MKVLPMIGDGNTFLFNRQTDTVRATVPPDLRTAARNRHGVGMPRWRCCEMCHSHHELG
jgi:hypothetical protein